MAPKKRGSGGQFVGTAAATPLPPKKRKKSAVPEQPQTPPTAPKPPDTPDVFLSHEDLAKRRKGSLRLTPTTVDILSPMCQRSDFGNRSIDVDSTSRIEPCEGSRMVNLRLLDEALQPHLRCPQCLKVGRMVLSRSEETDQELRAC